MFPGQNSSGISRLRDPRPYIEVLSLPIVVDQDQLQHKPQKVRVRVRVRVKVTENQDRLWFLIRMIGYMGSGDR